MAESITFTVTCKALGIAAAILVFAGLALIILAVSIFARLGKLLSEIEGLYWRQDDHNEQIIAIRGELGGVRERLGEVAGMIGVPLEIEEDGEEDTDG